jgi:hypothetical protein
MSNEYKYPIGIAINYTDNKSYRKCLREVFKMDTSAISFDADIDDESRDENEYDIETSIIAMNYISNETINHPLFQTLYDKAAGLFMSTNRDHGLPVLFCYDYFNTFHVCLSEYLNAPDVFTDITPSYLTILSKFN